jgi:predicted MFS family arabinose efflux permease
VPAGTFIGAYFDWRVAFVAATVLATVVMLLQLLFLPKIVMDDHVSFVDLAGVMTSPRNVAALLTLACTVGGHYAGYTFVAPYLEQVTHLGATLVSSLLLAYGLFSIAGNFIGGALAARSQHGTVLGNNIVFLLSLLALAVFGANAWIVGTSLMAWALVWGVAPVSTQLWIFGGASGKPEAVGAVLVAVLQLAIALGSFVGGLAVNGAGVHSAIWLGVLIVAVGIALVTLVGRIDRRRS